MEIIRNFGFEPVFFIAQIINFLILAAIFKRFLYKPVLNMLRDREKKIAQGIKDAEETAIVLENAERKKDEIIKLATLEAEKVIKETKESSESLRLELLETAKREAQRVIDEATLSAKDIITRAGIEAKELSLDLSKRLLDRILSEMFTVSEKEKILERNIKRLSKLE